jgi:hypothetical protein
MEITGSCYCNAIQFRVNDAPRSVVNCHCNFCRKHSGAAFSTYVAVPETAMEIISGIDLLSTYQFEENMQKHFCKLCGSPIFNRNALYPGLCMIYLGAITASLSFVPTANIYCESQLTWVPSIAELRAFPLGIGKRTGK